MKEKKLLLDSASIKKRIAEMAGSLKNFCRQEDFLLVWLKDGAAPFAREFISHFDDGLNSLGVRASSYGNDFSSKGIVHLSDEINGVSAKKILLLDDILETGYTAHTVCRKLKSVGAVEIKTCFLLSKSANRQKDISPDFIGFEIPDIFVFGFGLDIKGEYRDLDEIYFIE